MATAEGSGAVELGVIPMVNFVDRFGFRYKQYVRGTLQWSSSDDKSFFLARVHERSVGWTVGLAFHWFAAQPSWPARPYYYEKSFHQSPGRRCNTEFEHVKRVGSMSSAAALVRGKNLRLLAHCETDLLPLEFQFTFSLDDVLVVPLYISRGFEPPLQSLLVNLLLGCVAYLGSLKRAFWC